MEAKTFPTRMVAVDAESFVGSLIEQFGQEWVELFLQENITDYLNDPDTIPDDVVNLKEFMDAYREEQAALTPS